jgi:putative membrane protein
MILLVDNLMKGFNTSGFFASALLAIVIALINALYSVIAGSDKD